MSELEPVRPSHDWKHYCKNYQIENREILAQKRKEKYEQNKAALLEKMKEYNASNREKLNSKRREKIMCEICEKEFTKGSMYNHLKSDRHLTQKLIKELQ